MLLGTNGSGKSTLDYWRAVDTSIRSDCILHPLALSSKKSDHQLMPTVGADIAFGLVEEKLSPAQIRQRVEEALAAVNLLELQRRPTR